MAIVAESHMSACEKIHKSTRGRQADADYFTGRPLDKLPKALAKQQAEDAADQV
jgi:hypothetical protein